MKRTLSILLAMLIALSLAACAPSGKHTYKKIKCPACGYQFDAPARN